MSIEPTIVSTLSSLFSGRVFPDMAPFDTPRPFLTYQQVGGSPSNSFCGNTISQNARIQFNVWADAATGGRAIASTLMRSVEEAVVAAPLYGVSLGSLVAEYDDITKYYGARQDFSFWF